MKLMVESVEHNLLDYVTESFNNEKYWRIKGPFLQSETKNKNGRTYPKSILSREIEKFKNEKIKTHRAMGELNHPESPQINPERVSHLIEELYMDGNDGIGVAKILNTPTGRTVQALLEGGVKLGVSSRSVGTFDDKGIVQDDLHLITIDIVGDPSALNAYVDGIYENVEYIIQGDIIVEKAVNNFKKSLSKNGSREAYNDLKRFLNEIRS